MHEIDLAQVFKKKQQKNRIYLSQSNLRFDTMIQVRPIAANNGEAAVLDFVFSPSSFRFGCRY